MNTFKYAAAVAVLGSLAAVSSAQFDQIGTGAAIGTAGNISQTFPAPNQTFTTMNIEDMTLTSTRQINSVDAVFIFFNGNGPTSAITDWHFAVYSNAVGNGGTNGANNTGNVADVLGITGANVTYTNNFNGVTGNTLVHIVLPTAVTLLPGTYWFGAAGTMDFAVGGEIGMLTSSTVDASSGANNARLMNGGGGFALAGNNAAITPAANTAYRLNTTATPEPATMAALGLGVIAMIRRRRKA